MEQKGWLMSATDEIRSLLDERGVEWTEELMRPYLTQVRINGKVVKYHQWQPGTLKVSLFDITPAQAIAATLGDTDATHELQSDAGTCEADETETIYCVGDSILLDSRPLQVHVMECTECGHTYEHVNGDYEYCPRCGRKRRDFVE